MRARERKKKKTKIINTAQILDYLVSLPFSTTARVLSFPQVTVESISPRQSTCCQLSLSRTRVRVSFLPSQGKRDDIKSLVVPPSLPPGLFRTEAGSIPVPVRGSFHWRS